MLTPSTFSYKNVFDHMHEGVIIIDSDTKVLYANRSYYEVLGIPIADIEGKYLTNIRPKDKINQVAQGAPAIINAEFRVDTTNIRVVANIVPIIENENTVGAVSVFRDVSEVTELVKELEQLKGYTRYLEEELTKTEEVSFFNGLIGDEKHFQILVKKIQKVAHTDSTVLLTGESGTGKEVVATSIYKASPRADKPMIKVNCAAIPDALMESEFFGYEDGAFTGARKGGKLGKFELAHKGTIYLDEIGEMSLNLQAKLLRVLQEQTIERIGSEQQVQVNVRVIASTNADLKQLVEEGEFRKDLYYRLNVFPIELPPLRERKADILSLAVLFLKQFCEEQKKQLSFNAKVQNLFLDYSWPGNIRELKNVVEHAVIMSEAEGRIDLDMLPEYLQERDRNTNNEVEDFLSQYHHFPVIEKRAIEEALVKTKGNRTEAMKLLEMSRKTFYKKLKQYNI